LTLPEGDRKIAFRASHRRSAPGIHGPRLGRRHRAHHQGQREVQDAVFWRTKTYLADLDPAELDHVVFTRPFPDQIASTFSARVAGEAGLTVSDGLECWIYHHGLRHMGEVLVGLQGMTS
jgi:hypothetical protein